MNIKGLPGLSAWLVYNKVVNNLVFCREFMHEQEDFALFVSDILELSEIDEIKRRLMEMTIPKRSYVLPSDCIPKFKTYPTDKKRALLCEALIYSDLSDDEMLRLLGMHNDKNGVAYSKINVASLNMDQIAVMCIDSLMVCAETDIDLSLVSSAEMDAIKTGRININDEVADILAKNPELPVNELLSLAIKKTLKKVGE